MNVCVCVCEEIIIRAKQRLTHGRGGKEFTVAYDDNHPRHAHINTNNQFLTRTPTRQSSVEATSRLMLGATFRAMSANEKGCGGNK